MDSLTTTLELMLRIIRGLWGAAAAPSILVERSARALLIWGLLQPVSLLSSVPVPASLSPSPVVEDQAAPTLIRAAAAWSLRATGKHTGTNGCVSTTDWHANHQMRDPHLVSWQPIVPAPNPSVARGSTPRPPSLPAAPAAAWVAASEPTALAVHMTGNDSHLAQPQAVRGLRPHAVGKVLSVGVPGCSVPPPATVVCSGGAVRSSAP